MKFALRFTLVLISGLSALSVSTSFYLFSSGVLPQTLVLLDVLFFIWLAIPYIIKWRIFVPKAEKHLYESRSDKQISLAQRLTKPAFAVLFFINLTVFLYMAVDHPHGDWDGWAIWNMHARFLFRGGADWQDYLTPELAWSHPDYPLFLPGLIARFWGIIGEEVQIVPVGIAALFIFSTLVVLVCGLAIVKSNSSGILAGIVLLGTPFYTVHGATQYADVPLAFFYVSALLMLCLHEREGGQSRWLYGAFTLAACAAWMKNEGLLFLIVLTISYGIVSYKVAGLKRLISDALVIIVACLPILTLIGIFKFNFAPENDLFGEFTIADFISRTTDLGRYVKIARMFLWEITFFGGGFLIILVGVMGILGRLGRESISVPRSRGIILLVLLLMLMGYFSVFVLTPRNLNFHLATALDRLVLHLWPPFLLWYFLSLRLNPIPDSKGFINDKELSEDLA